MSRLLKSRGYFMKSLGFVLLLGFISLGAIGGCSDNNGGQDGTRALTENDFATDDNLRANLEKHTVVNFLEHPESEGHENDTGEVGNDTVLLRYNRTVEHTYCWDDDTPEAGHFMELDDSHGNEILRVEANGECVTEIIEAGKYVLTLHHDGEILTTYAIFIIPNPEDTQEAKQRDGLFNGFKIVIANILQGIQNTVSKDARAQSSTECSTTNECINTLIKTRKCMNCDLVQADLHGQNLVGVELSGADLTLADLRDANLAGANLTLANLNLANLNGAILTGAILFQADLNQSKLNGAELGGADLRDAKLNAAKLSGANLSGADLSGAQLGGAELFEANLSGAKLIQAIMIQVNLSSANLSGADLTNANIGFGATLLDADLSFANVSNANLNKADLGRADLSDSNLTGADLTETILSDVNLIGANLSNADLSGAVWCDSMCECADNSVGSCVGCAPANICIGPQ